MTRVQPGPYLLIIRANALQPSPRPLNGGPVYQLSPAISLFVNCETQEEIDELWEKLSGGGETVECGWLKDKCAKVSGMVATTDPLVDHLIALFKRAASNPTFRSGRTM